MKIITRLTRIRVETLTFRASFAIPEIEGGGIEKLNHDKSKNIGEAPYIEIYELGINKDRYKSLADEMDSTFAELAGY